MCCSTYYSYIGIYNSVNSPINYLLENYVRISHELTTKYEAELEENLGSAREALGTATSLITARYTSLISDRQQYAACRNALNEVEISYTSGLRPPKQSSYENYEDYAAAYQAYINSASQGNNAEKYAFVAVFTSSVSPNVFLFIQSFILCIYVYNFYVFIRLFKYFIQN